MVWEGLDAVRTARKMLGETRPLESLPGTIRGDFCLDVGYGAVRSPVRSAYAAAFDAPEQQACCGGAGGTFAMGAIRSKQRSARSACGSNRVHCFCPSHNGHNGHGREHDPNR